MEDEKDILFQLRNSFYLGNYYKVLEMWKEYASFNYTTYGNLVRSIIIRSIVKLGANYKKFFEGLDISTLKKDIPVFGKYLSPLAGKLDTETAEEIIKDFTSNYNENYEHFGTIIRLLWLATGNYEAYAAKEANTSDMEALSLLFYCYENMKRFDLSNKVLTSMKLKDEEDIATSLCSVHQLLSNRKNNEAIAMIDELKERFEDSAKLNNLKVAALIALGKFDQALVILNKLFTVLTNKEQLYDQSELETVLSNLIICSLYQGANYDEYVQILARENPEHSILKTLV